MLLPFSFLVFAVAQEPRPAQQLDLGSLAYDPAVISHADLSVALWKDGVSSELYASSSDGRGLHWSAPVRVDDDLSGSSKFVSARSLAFADGVVYAAWRDARNGDLDVYFSRSTDGGQSWSASLRLDDGYAAGAQAVDYVQVVADESYVYVAMRVDTPSGGEDIWMASSMDHGATWNPTLQANTAAADCDYVSIACEGANAFVTFADNRNSASEDDLFLRMTHNGGVSWMMNMLDEQIDEGGPNNGDVEAPELLISGGMTGLVVGWLEDQTLSSPNDEELHIRYSPNGGHMWPLPESTLGAGFDVENPSIAFDGATIIAAWEDDRSGRDEIYAAVSRDFGLSWTEHSISQGGGSYPAVFGAEDLWAISYTSGGFPEGTALAISRDGANSFLDGLDLKGGLGNDTDFNELAHNEHYQNFIAVWLDDASGSNNLFVGGARSQTLQAVSSTFAPGDSLHFEASHFPASDDGALFAVFVSRGVGNYAVPYGDGRNTGLLSNPYLPAKLHLLSGTLDADGFGTTPQLTIPNTPGVTWYATALSYLVSSTTGKVYTLTMTDRTGLTVQ